MSIDKANKRKIHTNTLFHLGFVHTSGYQRGESPSNASRPTHTHTHTHIHTTTTNNEKNNEIMKMQGIMH